MSVCRDAKDANLPFLAPEQLMGCRWHSQAADMWAVGCVLAHLHSGKLFLAGKSRKQQLGYVFRVCGSPAIVWRAATRFPATKEALDGDATKGYRRRVDKELQRRGLDEDAVRALRG